MAGMATVATPHLCGRVRRRSARPADVAGAAEPFRFLPTKGAYTFRNRAAQWWLAVAARLQPAREAEGSGRRPEEAISVFAFRSIHLSPRGSDHRRFVADLFRAWRPPRQTVFYPGAWDSALAVFSRRA